MQKTISLSGIAFHILQAYNRTLRSWRKCLKGVIKEVATSDGEIILFIDEIHTLVGAGGGEGAMDAANILKPALARGELRAIGATTLNEYQKYFEKDKALERRFQKVFGFNITVLVIIGNLLCALNHLRSFYCKIW